MSAVHTLNQDGGVGIAYIMSRFPKLSETFILREMLEVERQGQPLVILPLLHVREAQQHPEVERVMAYVHYTPLLSPAIVWANVRYALVSPRRYFATLWLALRGSWGSMNLFIGAIGIFPKSVYFARLIEMRGIRHVHAHYATHPALAAFIISELTGTTFSFTAHAHDIFVDTQMLYEKIMRARFVVTISEFNKHYLLRLYPDVPPDKIRVIHCGVEVERSGNLLGLRKTDRFTLLCVASLQPYKGIAYLVKACALLKPTLGDFKCFIIGEGSERTRLERLIAELDLRKVVYLLGARTQGEVASLLTKTDLFVLSSVVAADGQMEGLPVALVEAMASGVPVIATRLSGIPELVEDGVTGVLVAPADEQALADAIMQLTAQDEQRAQMAERARAKVAGEFDLRANVAQLRALFLEANWQDRLAREIQSRLSRYSITLNGMTEVALERVGAGHDSHV